MVLRGALVDAPDMRLLPSAPAPPHARIRVLVVDDNEGFRESLAALLQGGGVEVVGTAASGPEALEQVRGSPPTSCSWTSGCRRWTASRRRSGSRRSGPVGVVALSGMEEQRAVRDMLVAGASGYVLKDSDGDEIIHAVRGGRRASPSSPPRSRRA